MTRIGAANLPRASAAAFPMILAFPSVCLPSQPGASPFQARPEFRLQRQLFYVQDRVLYF